MFKKLPNLILAAAAIVAFNFEVSAQSCTPDASNTTDGFTPAAPFTFPAGETGDAYEQVLQFRIPDSVWVDRDELLANLPATVAGFPTATVVPLLQGSLPAVVGAKVESVEITGVAGLHQGFAFATSWCGGGNNCVYLSQTNGCLSINGTPTIPGDSLLEVLTSTVLTVDFGTVNIPLAGPTNIGEQTLPGSPQIWNEGDYSFNVTGDPISANQVEAITSVNIYPQPASNNIFVDFNANKSEVLNVEIYDLVGKRVYFETVNIMEGFNHLQINSTDFTEGMYIYTVTDANRNQKFSNRIIISK